MVLTLGAAAIRLYLTFTSFCISGDGIEQNDSRILYGGQASYTR